MSIKDRLQALEHRMKSLVNDEGRYAVAEKIRDLGYIDFRDFSRARPAAAHVEAVERALGTC